MQIDSVLQSGAGGIMVVHTTRDDFNNACGCGPMPILRTMAEITRGADCIVKNCP
jgi:hypothetical protein